MSAVNVFSRICVDSFSSFVFGERSEESDLGDVILQKFNELTNARFGPFEPSPWICINAETGEIGRGYEEKGRYNIVTFKDDEEF